MGIIKQNPFRVLGLLSNSTERELQKQIGIMKRYAEIGKTKSFDYDLELIGNLTRTPEDIQLASSNIEQAQKKLLYSLFWFIKSTQFDEIALKNLISQNLGKAIEIWDKTLKEGVTEKNVSSYLNLSTLYLALSTINDQLEIQRLQQTINLKGQLIHSDHFHVYISFIAGDDVVVEIADVSKKFVNEIIELLKPYINKDNGISASDLISLFDNFPPYIRKYLSGKFTETPISNIENNIEKTISRRKENPRDADEYGEELYQKTKVEIKLLKKLLGKSNMQFQMIANKLANEILQCSIDFFNELRKEDGDIDPGDVALRIAKYALSIGPSGQIKQRLTENTAVIQEWVNDKPNRQRHEAVAEDIAFVSNKLRRFQELSGKIDNAKDLIVSCKPKLSNIKGELGVHDEFYLKVSNAVVGNALGMLVTVVNNEQEQVKYNKQTLLSLSSTISSAFDVVKLMGSLDMNEETRDRYNTNKQAIYNIKTQLPASRTFTPTVKFPSLTKSQRMMYDSTNSSSKRSSSGCYIATMAYGDYQHPQVILLRKFRDERLTRNLIGNHFITFYYSTSPHLVKLLKNNKRINSHIRRLLNTFIKYIK